LLVDGHDPREWARVLGGLLDDGVRRRAMQAAAVGHAARFGWDATVTQTLAVYAAARRDHRKRGVEPATFGLPAARPAMAMAPAVLVRR
jgi:D-inositol-3-phosphate glycosyltransferase